VLIKKQERSEKTKKEGIATTQFTKEERKGGNGTKTV
jgi:hypothetical protein